MNQSVRLYSSEFLRNSVTYDIETYPNCFTLAMECLYSDINAIWEISHFRDDRALLMQWFNSITSMQAPMIGFNNLHFDYPVIHYLFHNPNSTVDQIYSKAQAIIDSDDKFAHSVWASDRFTPQIDLMKVHHFDNIAKRTSLKALQVNMRSNSVEDLPIAPGTVLTQEQVDHVLVPYNRHDVKETKQFALYSQKALDFRVFLIDQFGVDVMNWSDTKIGSKMMEQKLGEELCYDRSSGRKKTRQTPRSRIALNDIIFPYIKFDNPEFNRVLDYLRQQVLKSQDIKQIGSDSYEVVKNIQTKGVFTDLSAHVGGIDFHFGTGGIHGSVEKQRIYSQGDWIIRDIDVASLYPSIAIVNRLSPEHLGQYFVDVYSELPKERKRWQAEKGKKCVEANTLKLASNGVYGNSNNRYSPFYDPKFTLTITVNGQLMLCMLAEKLATVPTLKLIQANTDGITYYIHKDYEPQAAQICQEWERLTALTLEDVNYKAMFIRDVNNYIAQDEEGNLKLKGTYWAPDALDYHNSIGDAQPPAWHKDLSNCVSTRAAVAAMVYGVDPETFIRFHANPFDFMCRIKVNRSDNLFYGDQEVNRINRYYVSVDGEQMTKLSPPTKPEGMPKKKNGVLDSEYERVMVETGNQWDERVCTKNKSIYETRRTAIQAGYKLSLCNRIEDFDFSNINYDWYINEAKKLII